MCVGEEGELSVVLAIKSVNQSGPRGKVADSRVRAKTNLFHTSVTLPGPRELKFKIAC